MHGCGEKSIAAKPQPQISDSNKQTNKRYACVIKYLSFLAFKRDTKASGGTICFLEQESFPHKFHILMSDKAKFQKYPFLSLYRS